MAALVALELLLKAGSWLALLWFVVFWMVKPSKKGTDLDYGFMDDVTTPTFGMGASWQIMFMAPFLVMLVLGCLYLQLTKSKQPNQLKNPKGGRPRVSLWTYPVLIRNYLGIVTAAELLILGLIVAWTLWVIIWFLTQGIATIDYEYWYQFAIDKGTTYTRWDVQVNYAGYYLGILSFVPMAFLFFPVSRGSALLRLVNIPFEHAVKYHKWVGFISLFVSLLHSLVYYGYYLKRGEFGKEWKDWPAHHENNLAGLIAMVLGLLIGVTSLHQIRNRYFEIFFGFHQLYVLFIVFTMIHIGQDFFYMIMAGVFLFTLDRFLRFIQSRKAAGLLSVRNLPGDTTELVFAKHPRLKYTPGSFIFLNIPALSRWWQWHPFTVTSTSVTEPDRISVLVKQIGSWTQGLQRLVEAQASASGKSSCPFNFGAAVEGPYGAESSEYLRYQSLILVAGGSGISPFIAFLKDLLHRHQTQQPGSLPTEVTLIWAVRKEDELRIIDCVALPLKLAPSLHLKVQGYVTRQQGADPEKQPAGATASIPYVYEAAATARPICPEAGKDSNWGHLAVVLASVLGYLLVWGLLARYEIHITKEHGYNFVAAGMLCLLAMLLGIVFFGGAAALIWTWIFRQDYLPAPVEEDKLGYVADMADIHQKSSPPAFAALQNLLTHDNTFYGSRPNLKGIFEAAAQELAGTNVGVLVCGPKGMQESVAQECQTHSSLLGSSVAFHFHSVSFDL